MLYLHTMRQPKMQLNLNVIILFDLLQTKISVFSTGANVHVQLQQAKNPEKTRSTPNSSGLIIVIAACVSSTVKPGTHFVIYRF